VQTIEETLDESDSHLSRYDAHEEEAGSASNADESDASSDQVRQFPQGADEGDSLAKGASRQPERRSGASHSGSEEQSIEEYMAALISRTRGGSPAEPVTAPQPKRNKRKSDPAPAPAPSRPEQPPRDVTSSQVVDMPLGETELARRSVPAEKTDLAAMRELANTQANIAITTHGKKRLLKRAVRAWGMGLAFVLGTVVVLSLAPDADRALRTGAMIGIVAGIYWMFIGLTATQQLIATERKRRKGLRACLEKDKANTNPS
jgi:hypothetical protein